MYNVSFTGHRPEKLPYYGENDPLCEDLKQRLKIQIEKLIIDGADSFFSGMARGVDMWCAEIVIELKAKYPELKLTAVIPCKTQANGWNLSNKLRYNNILEHCDKKIYISDEYSKGCMLRRDRALVELCDVLVAVFDGKKGGTKYTVDYAEKSRKKVVMIPPK